MTQAEAIKELAESRHEIARDYGALRRQFDFPARAKCSIIAHPLRWLGGAAIFGFLLSPSRKKRARARKAVKEGKAPKEQAKALGLLGILIAVFRVLLPVLKPTLTAFAARRFADFAGKLK